MASLRAPDSINFAGGTVSVFSPALAVFGTREIDLG
jgi:hypothetical protein